MGFLQDNLIPFFRKRDLLFVERRKESDGIYTFRFKKESDLTWKAGQYGLFTITHKKIKNATRPFSVSSAPAENIVQFTTHIRENQSEFKKALFELEQGMSVNMRGPVGPFYITENRPSLFIAGGIGITPFRSILKQLELNGIGEDQAQIHLLYLDHGKSYLFKDEFDQIASKPSIHVSYLESRDELYQQIENFTAAHKDGQYFISGPKAMVNESYSQLQKQHVSKQQIKKDVFFGY